MAALKVHDSNTLLTLPAKRLKTEPRTYYGSRRGDKIRGRRTHSSEGLLIPHKTSKTREKYTGPPTLVLDNGSYTAKIGISTDNEPRVIPNCIMKVKSERKRFFIGNQIEECRDLSGLYYMLPCDKGYTTKWNVQKPVWDYIFNHICPLEDNPVIMTQPILNFRIVQEIIDEIFYEEYEVKSMLRVTPTDLAKYEYVTNIVGKNVPCVIVDSGFTYTYVVPYIGGKKYYKGIKRISVGGKVLTNYLKDIISYRQLHVMDETYVINQVKEDVCYVSSNFKEDMRISSLAGDQNTIVKSYVLPDFNTIRRGYIQDTKGGETNVAEGCQILRLNNERFSVPELLFNPSDVGMESRGIAHAIVRSILRCPVRDQPLLAKNIVIVGGSACFPGFKERVYADVRSHLPDHWTVNIYKPDNPITFTWKGGKSLSDDPKIKSLLVTKEQYDERGSAYTYERFSDWTNSHKKADQEKRKPTETVPIKPGILQTSNFSRLDLFGKSEPEAEEIFDLEEESNDTDKVTAGTSTSDSTKNSDGINNSDGSKDSKDAENDGESSVNRRESITENYQEDMEESYTSKSTVKASKSGKTTINIQNTTDSSGYSFLDSYDFDIFSNSFI